MASTTVAGTRRPYDQDHQRLPSPSEITPLLDNSEVGGRVVATQDSDEAADEQTLVVQDMSNTRLYLTMVAIWVGVFLGATEITVIATLSGPISSEFKSLSLMSWLASSYLIANAAFQPVAGRLTDIFGRGPGLVLSNLLFAAGNLMCGLARDEYTMLAGRVLAGLGGGGLMCISTFVASDLVPLRKRGVFQGIGNVCYGSGAMLGSVLGGVINDNFPMGWRLVFLGQVPLVLISALLVAYLVRIPPKQSEKSCLSRVDFGGVFLIVLFLVLLLIGLNAGGNVVPWTHSLVLTTLPLSIVALVLFVWWEDRTLHPVIPVRLLLDRTIAAACITNFLCTMVIITAFFYVPIYLQVLDSSPSEAGFRIMTSPFGSATASLACGWIMKKTGKYYKLAVACMVIHLGGAFLTTFMSRETPSWFTSIVFLFLGSGYGGMLTVTLLACLAAVDQSQQAVITSATYAFRSVGSTMGVTIASAIYQNVLQTRLWQHFGHLPGAAQEIARIRDDLSELNRLPAGWRDGVIDSFMDAFARVWLMTFIMTVLAFVSTLFLREHFLHGNLVRNSIARE